MQRPVTVLLLLGVTLSAIETIQSFPLAVTLPIGALPSPNCSAYCNRPLAAILCCLEEQGLSVPLYATRIQSVCSVGTVYCTTPVPLNLLHFLPFSNSSAGASACSPTSVTERQPSCDSHCGGNYDQSALGQCCRGLNNDRTAKPVAYPLYQGGNCGKIDCLIADLNDSHAYCDFIDNFGAPA